jgi:exodeoxyribonuclease VII large subunit
MNESGGKHERIWSLREVADSIQRTILRRYGSQYWIKAEIAKLHYYKQSGNCYVDLVEKTEKKIVAQMKGIIWADAFLRINEHFLRLTKEPLKDGITILFLAAIRYSPIHGLSLYVSDIDPNYTLGEMAREKQATIDRLKKENIFGLNKQLPFPLLPQRIAVISVQTSKGYSDFCKKIDRNPWGYKLFYLLFPSLLQGDEAVDAMIGQLKRILTVRSHFDVVAIIRGGGGEVGLNCFDNYRFAKEVAVFPLPVLTGIGHSTNETVTEMVACRNNITPTDLADFLLQRFHDFSVPVEESRLAVINGLTGLMASENEKLNRMAESVQISTNILVRNEWSGLNQSLRILQMVCGNLISREQNNLDNMSGRMQLLDPQHVLKRGYSMTLLNGKILTDHKTAVIGDILETRLADGRISSIVESTTE